MHNTDTRIQVTRTMFHQAMLALLEEKAIGFISVKELCARAGLNRGTFYLHYSEPIDVLHEMEESVQEKVNPVITFIPTGDIVELTESVNLQKFKITCKEWTFENTVEIDCINRKITILDYVDSEGNIIEKDITSDGDINNDWFVLHKEYNFETDNCILQTVRFTERW